MHNSGFWHFCRNKREAEVSRWPMQATKQWQAGHTGIVLQATLTQYTQNIDGNLLLKDLPRAYLHPFLYISCDTYYCQCMLSYLLVAIPPEVCHSHSASITFIYSITSGRICDTLFISLPVCLFSLFSQGRMHCLHGHTTCKLRKLICGGTSYPKVAKFKIQMCVCVCVRVCACVCVCVVCVCVCVFMLCFGNWGLTVTQPSITSVNIFVIGGCQDLHQSS